MDDVTEGKDFSFPKQEEKILEWWTEVKAFETQLEKTKDLPEYIFYDGPPFATGLPHYGHILAGTIKDIVTRYQTMTGHHVTRRFGWDCHGLPVEHEIDTKLGIKSREDVMKMGIDKYNEECRSIVTRYVGEWEKVITRTGRWIDFKNDYKTMDLNFMESVWWVFSELFKKNLVYRGFKVMPYSTGCKTPLSNFEANSNYKDVPDPEIMVTFPILDAEDGAAFVAWTTTPWTLPSNLALCVNSKLVYVKVKSKSNGNIYVVAESRLSELPVEKPKKGTPSGPVDDNSLPKIKGSTGGKAKNTVVAYEILEKFPGSSLVGKKYVPLFDYFKDFTDTAFRVVADDYVTSDSGTGIVHCAPAFGEDDYRVCLENQIINKGENLVMAVDDDGCFTKRITDFSGRYVKEADKDIILAVKEKGRLLKSGNFMHSYPFCWRSDTPLIYRAVPSWFVAVEKLKDRLLENTEETTWVPAFVKEKRFHNWLENARDWAISRSRFWGTPLPIWISKDGVDVEVIGSVEELERRSGVKVTDLHRHKIDHFTIPSPRGPEFGELHRVEDVFDCWFESGSMPYAYIHYPFENKEFFNKNFPGHFVAEGLDQTRGWFYTLMVLSTALFDKPAFRNLICNGLVLAEDGKKMSKRLKNYPSPMEVIDDYGADALRLYIINSPVVRAEPLRFKKEGVYNVVKDVFLPWYNAYRFLVQNAKRLEVGGLASFVPLDRATLVKSANVLDQWINSATQSLVHFVRQEMDAYRLYTVVPYLLKFIDNLTNIYVRFNRKRLKGRTGEEDCRTALSTLYYVLLTTCKAMAPFTPFFTEVLYKNLRKISNGSEESIHFCSFPEVEGKGGDRIEQSVNRMMTIIDHARNIRERHNKPLKTPLKEMIVVHPDAEFLDDITSRLKEFRCKMDDVTEGKDFSFPKQEEKILEWWTEVKAFETQLEKTKDLPEYIFYDGPPFATGLPHYGHILAGTIKDIVTRYQTMTGHHVTRRFGWDCHGLPVEHEIDTKLGIKSREDVMKMGIDKYNEECRSIVTRYVGEWEKVITRTGRWIDFKNDYKTMDLNFMESVWWVFSELFKKNLVYRGFKVMPYSTGCKTPLSNFEANSNYKDVPDPEIMVTFPILDAEDGAAFVAWTTTPWTLSSNLALCVNSKLVYVKVKSKSNGNIYVVAESRLSELPVEKPKKGTPSGPVDDNSLPKTKGSTGGKAKNTVVAYEILEKFPGSSLVGKKYVPLFDYFKDFTDTAFRVVADDYVTSDSGTGIVHCAPAFGEDDYRVCLENQIINKGENLVMAVDDDGCFTKRITDFSGRYVKEADKDIILAVKEKGRLVKSGNFMHSYPFCWRSDTPLIYRAVPSWFVAVEKLKDRLLDNTEETTWVPAFVKEKRFHNWLENARDWAISRSRFWGTPLPIWISKDGVDVEVIGSVEELERRSGVKVTDLHRHKIDHITIPSPRGPEFGELHRVEDVFDCWFESGSMPYAYIHYPFENKEFFNKNFPGHFVAEGLDQTRGWFYTLMVLSTALFDKPAFRNLICNGLVLAEDGKKMSKRLKNYPSPMEVIDDYGADALRLYIINSPVVRAEPLRFKKEGVYNVVKDVFLPWYNAYRFLVQNAKRLEVEGLASFVPLDRTTLVKSANVLDQWINSATQSLVHFVRQEMDAYRLYTVVPYLLKFIDNLTNIYVRFNRKRLKGRTGEEDCRTALSTLYYVLLTSCKAMAPFTPFFTEVLYKNLRKISNGSEESIHFCSFPEVEGKGGDRIEQSVNRMMTIIDHARNIRERHNKPLKTPLKEMIVVHPDAEFLDDITSRLKEYVLEELNVKSVVPCKDQLKYSFLRAEPDFSVLGKRLGKSMRVVAEAVKAMSQEDILSFEKAGEITIATHCLKLTDIKIVRGFKRPDGVTEEEMDASSDGDVLVILDLHSDDSLFEAGFAREVVNRVQKLRKTSGLEPTDRVEVYFKSLDEDPSVPASILKSQETYIREVLGSSLLDFSMIPKDADIIVEETYKNISNCDFTITLSRATSKVVRH